MQIEEKPDLQLSCDQIMSHFCPPNKDSILHPSIKSAPIFILLLRVPGRAMLTYIQGCRVIDWRIYIAHNMRTTI